MTAIRRVIPAATISVAMLMFTAAGSAQSLPGAINYIPANAPFVVAIPSIDGFSSNVQDLVGRFGDMAGAMDLGPIAMLTQADGINTSSALVAALLELPEDGAFNGDDKEQFIVLVPVSDYSDFAKGIGADTSGVGQTEIEGEPAYIKSIGNGYALMGPSQDLVSNFNADNNSAKFFASLAGTSGMSVAGTSDAFAIINLEVLRPHLREGLKEMSEDMADQMAMVPNGQQAAEMYTMIATNVVEDGKSSVVGFDANDAGLLVRATVGFMEGSKSAKYMSSGSNAGSVISHLPDMPYIVAFATDNSAPGINKMMKDYKAITEKMMEGAETPASMEAFEPISDALAEADGVAFVMGTNPIITAGAFVNSVSFIKTHNPDKLRETFGQTVGDIAALEIPDVTFTSSYAQEAKDINGTMVDTWKLRPKFDPNSEIGAQAPMAMMGMFGPAGGPSGLIASADSGVVLTMSKNSRLMQNALDAANGGGQFGTDDLTRKVGSALPSNRFMEGYFSLADTWAMVENAAQMMGGLPFDFDMPENTPPIGFGVGAGDETMAVGLFLPNQLFDMIASIQEQMGGMGGGFDDDMGDDDNGRF